MDIEKLFKSADFSKETDFKERLYQKLNMIRAIRSIRFDDDDEISDDRLDDIVAAGGALPVSINLGHDWRKQ